MRFFFTLILFLFFSCNSKELESKNDILKLEVTKLNVEVKNLKNEIHTLKNKNSKIVIRNSNNLIFFDPNGLEININSKRPLKNDNNISLNIPAAFTDSSNKIDGLFIEKGFTISRKINKKLNGTCIISNKKVKYINTHSLSDKIICEVIAKKQSLFQQQLLVFNSKIIKCNLFKNKLNLRRAIIEINNHFYIVQSIGRISILDFQNLLISISAKNAIYLDMGTYSEGWYENDVGKITIIGETMINTNKQSNWIVFEKI